MAVVNLSSGSDLKRIWSNGRSSEVHFKGIHHSRFPWGENGNWPVVKQHLPYQRWRVDITELCHVTHKDRFEQIRQSNDQLVLKPAIKRGKKRQNYLPQYGLSYTPIIRLHEKNITDDTQYREVTSEDEFLLPGYYIWWSIHLRNLPQTKYSIRVSDIFTNPPSSVYGSWKISANTNNLFCSYQNAFHTRNGHFPRIEFRNGGTLRYKHEICYVILVCAKGYFNGSPEDYPLMEAFVVEYDENERVSFVIPFTVTIQNCITYIRNTCTSYSWDQYVFAFHFPPNNDPYQLILDKDAVEITKTGHDFCLKYPNGCPDSTVNQLL